MYIYFLLNIQIYIFRLLSLSKITILNVHMYSNSSNVHYSIKYRKNYEKCINKICNIM